MKRLKKLLKVPQYQAVGIMESIWLLCQSCCEYGDIGRFSDQDIADHLEWEGDPAALVKAMADAGWLDPVDGPERYVIHDWLDEAPEFIWDRIRKREARASRTKRAAAVRSVKTYDKQKPDASGECPDASGECPESPAVPIPTQPNQTKPGQSNADADAIASSDPPETGPPALSREGVAFGKFKVTTPGFQFAWDSYPVTRRTRKVEAQVEWDKAVDLIMIRDKLERYKAEDWLYRRILEFSKSPAAQVEWCVHIATWIKSGKYDDPPEAWAAAAVRDRKDKASEPKESQYPKLTAPKDTPNGGRPIRKAHVAQDAPAPATAAASG